MADGDIIKRVSGAPGENSPYKGEADYLRALSRGRKEGLADDPTVNEMRKNRRVNSRTASASGGGGYGNSSLSFASGRPQDPMFYWKQNNLPFDYKKPEELQKIRAYARLIYATHPVIASAIDVYSKYPLTGMEITSKDSALTDFYSTLFLDQLCNPAEAPIWMGDYSFKSLGEVREGDEVIGWEMTSTNRRKLKRSKVLEVRSRMADNLVKVTFESGRELVCTDDHVWANYRHSPSNRKKAAERGLRGAMVSPREEAYARRRMVAVDLFEQGHRPSVVKEKMGLTGNIVYIWHGRWKDGGREALEARPYARGVNQRQQFHVHDEWTTAYPGAQFVHLIDPTSELTDPKQREVAAWLAGIYDGEGCGKTISQSLSHNPEVRDRIKWSLDLLGIQHAEDDANIYIQAPRGSRSQKEACQEFVDFLNWTDPVRKSSTQVDKKILTTRGGSDRVVSVEPVGSGEVFSLTTETGNYTAWGFASKNCYEEYLVDLGREKWTVGEAWPLGSFNETLGVWEDDELINPDDVDVIRSPFLKDPRFEMRLPESLRRIIEKREPKWEFDALMRSYPELKNFIGHEARMPVSNVLLKQVKFKVDTFSSRGLPILMRGFRSIMQEEMLNAAQDAIASRLYTPLVLAKLGASAADLGTNQPWIPTDDDLADFEEALDAALAGDFRVLTHHFAVSMETVFGRENMPNMDNDFDRLTERQLQVFGLSKTMLSGSAQGETYAADAINRDVVSQLLTDHQRQIKKFFHDRAAVVAEAQEHYDYEERGGKRYPIMEEVLEVDEETGEQRIVEQPKLLVPELHIRAMTMRDESDQRQFFEALRASGVPISMKSRLVNVPLDLDDEIERTRVEQVAQAVEAQQTRKETFMALESKGLPIPDDLENDFRAKAIGAKDDKAEEKVIPTIGTTDPASTQALAPTPAETAQVANDPSVVTPATSAGAPAPGGATVIPLPTNRALERTRPPESDEQRAGMPKASSRVPQALPETETGYRLRTVAAKTVTEGEGDDEVERIVMEESWSEVEELNTPEGPNRLISGPRHIGARRYSGVIKDVPLDEQGLA